MKLALAGAGGRQRGSIGLDFAPDRMHVVHNGITVEDFSPPNVQCGDDAQDAGAHSIDDHAPTIGFLARMHPSKGLHTLVNAYLIIRAAGRLPHVRLRIADRG